MPAAGYEPPEGRVERGLRVDVEVLGIEAPAEVDDLGLGHLVRSEIDDLPRREVLEEQRRLGPSAYFYRRPRADSFGR